MVLVEQFEQSRCFGRLSPLTITKTDDCGLSQQDNLQITAVAGRTAQRSASGPPCCTQMLTRGQCNKLVTDQDHHQFTTLS